MRSRSRIFADKSISSMLAAIEVYNKPNFEYREEAFSILVINAWEILLKARILLIEQNNLSSVLLYENRRLKNGKFSKKLYVAKNRSGSNKTIGLFQSLDKLTSQYGESIPKKVRKNLELLYEIRNNATHFINKGPAISKMVQELGAACLKNYMKLIREWFDIDLSAYNFFLMPLSFFSLEGKVNTINLSPDERKVFDFISKEIATGIGKNEENLEDKLEDYNVSLEVKFKFIRSKEAFGGVTASQKRSGTPVTITEEDLSEKYPWSYNNLTTYLENRYEDFKRNAKYHEIRKILEENEQFCKTRYLDPRRQIKPIKKFYNPSIVSEFDKHYVRKV